MPGFSTRRDVPGGTFSARLSFFRRLITPTVGCTVIMLIAVNLFPITTNMLAEVELVAGPDDVNLEDRLGKLDDEDHQIVRDVGPRILRHVAKEVKHEQFYGPRRAHGDRGFPGARVMAWSCGCSAALPATA